MHTNHSSHAFNSGKARCQGEMYSPSCDQDVGLVSCRAVLMKRLLMMRDPLNSVQISSFELTHETA